MTRLGGWLFRWRTILPLPLAAAILLWPAHTSSSSQSAVLLGITLAALGEGVRLWGVHHIGTISRTRSGRLGPLVTSGPFAIVRNPLYVGNVLLWTGLAVSARAFPLAPLILVLLGFEYHAIVRWEERLLEERYGAEYRDYAARVGRWMPRSTAGPAAEGPDAHAPFSWRDTLFSERGTLIAIGVGYVLLWIKSQV